MKNTKRKIMLTGFVAVLMMTLPFTSAVYAKKESENLQLKAISVQADNVEGIGILQLTKVMVEMDLMSVVLDILETLEKTFGLKEIESGAVELDTQEMNLIINSAFQNMYQSYSTEIEPLDIGDAGYSILSDESKEIETSFEVIKGSLGELELEENPTFVFGGSLIAFILKYMLENKVVRNFVKNGFWMVMETIDETNEPRLGYINPIANFTVNEKRLRENLEESFWPNLTKAEVIDKTIEMLINIGVLDEEKWGDFQVYDFIYSDELNLFLMDKVENLSFKIQGLGIRQKIYDDYIKPILLDQVESGVLQDMIWDHLDQKVYWGKGILDKFEDNFQFFLGALNVERGKDRRKGLLVNGTRLIGTICRVGVSAFAYLAYMNDSEIKEYFSHTKYSLETYYYHWEDFYCWLSASPWEQNITIKGTVLGVDESRLQGILIYTQSKDNSVLTDESGDFLWFPRFCQISEQEKSINY